MWGLGVGGCGVGRGGGGCSPHKNFKEQLDGVPLLQFLGHIGCVVSSLGGRWGRFIYNRLWRLGCCFGFLLGFGCLSCLSCRSWGGGCLLGIGSLESVAATKNWITLYSLLMKCRWTLRNTSDVKFGISVPAVRIESTLWEVITKEFMFVVMIFKYKNGDQTSAKEVVWEQVLIPDAIDGITPVNNASIYHSSCFPEEPNSTCGGCLDFCCHAV